jgi:hypothetical protein
MLLDLASNADGSVVGLAMARSRTIRHRIEWILEETVMPSKMSWGTWAALVACLLPLTVIAAGTVVAQAPATGDATPARRVEQMGKTEVYVDPKTFDNYVGYYQLPGFSVYTVTRQGDRLYIQINGLRPSPLFVEGPQRFVRLSSKKDTNSSYGFDTDPQGRATGLILDYRGRKIPGKRIEEAQAKTLLELIAKRLKEPTPLPGAEAALRRQIEAFHKGQPAYHEMTAGRAAMTRHELAHIQRWLASVGPLRSVALKAGYGGWDVYEVKFENGMATCKIQLSEDGKVSFLLFEWEPSARH